VNEDFRLWHLSHPECERSGFTPSPLDPMTLMVTIANLREAL
jgi:hypothetical protein